MVPERVGSRRVSSEYTATMHTIAAIFDVGSQFLRQAGAGSQRVLPRTYEEYVRHLYGDRPRDPFYLYGWGLIATVVLGFFALLAISR